MAKTQSWYRFTAAALQRGLRRLVGGLSLERKSLLFLAVALMIPIGLSFWFVLRVVADPLKTTRQTARDYAKAVVAWSHSGISNPLFQDPEVAKKLKENLVDNPEFGNTRFFMLEGELEHAQLQNAIRPRDEREERLLTELHTSYRKALESLDEAKTASYENAIDANQGDQGATGETIGSEQLEELFSSDAAVRDAMKRLESLYVDDGPFFPSANELAQEVNPRDTPAEGWYVYYHAIAFPTDCMPCHERYSESDADPIPFRAVEVKLPYSQTQVASNTTLALMIAVAMVTVAATLLVVHWVFRKLVLTPLRHLQTVSEEISRGNTDLRANIDTGDEFNELGDAFNRMLRHMTEGQEELQLLNEELDLRVDQLAQANFNLYEANRLKSDFLANMSHELRTPLNSIIGFSDVLRDIESLSDKQKKYANNIQSSGKLLLEMINEILDLAKIEAGKMQVTPSAFTLQELISGQCDLLRALVDDKNVDLKSDGPEEPIELFQDRAKMLQILTNLLSNAIKFTPDGGMITVTVSTCGPDMCRIDVEDTGVGIPESDFEIIFEKFRQSNAVLQNDGLTRQFAGTGLGLSIVKELCKLLGGEIRLTSQLGTGSTFSVFLPTHFEAGNVRPVSESDAVSSWQVGPK